MSDLALPSSPHALPAPTQDGAFLMQVLEALPDGVCIIDRSWRFTYMNQRGYEVVDTHDVVGHSVWELFPGNNEEPFNTTYRTTMEERTAHSFEAHYDSGPLDFWLRVEAKPHPDGIIIFFTDITPRKQAEMQAQELARQLAQVLEATAEAVLSIDREWRFTYLNGNAQVMIDPEKKLLGQVVWDAFPAARENKAWKKFHQTMNERIGCEFEDYYPQPLDRWFKVISRPSLEGIVVFFQDSTEQRRRDQTVASQQELLTVVQRAARAATWELNFETGKLTYGPGSFDLFGYEVAEFNTLDDLRQRLLPGHYERIRESMAEALRTGASVVVEFAVNAADGRAVWIESRGEAVAESPHLLRGMSIDVTQRKLDEIELLASGERYRVLADLNPQALWAGDAAGNIVYANKGFLAYIGLTLADLDGTGWLEGFAPSDRERVVAVWTRSVTTGEDYEIEAMIRHAATGEYRYWLLRARPVRDSNGHIVQWLGIGSDIHEAKTTAAELRAEQAETERKRLELETIYKTTPVGLALFDPVEFRFLNLNEHEAEMLGYPREVILGRRLDEVTSVEGLPQLMGMFRSVAAGKTIRDFLLEGELPSRPGERRAWSVNYSPIWNANGTVRAISTASIEITNQKKAEQALVQSEKLAAVGRLASSISHEINNPLEAITNLMYLVAQDEALPPALKVYVHMAQSELSRVSQIATQTLRFHRQAVNPTPVTAAELVDAVVRLYTGRLANSNIRIDARYATETKILCFENDIRQVMNNLIANAIDAMRLGGRLILRAHDAHIERAGVPIAGVRITVADTGHGMTPEVLARVFEPFFTTKDLNGTGLGLWISAGIIDRHEGRLQVRSSVAEGKHGTVFTLFLPRGSAQGREVQRRS